MNAQVLEIVSRHQSGYWPNIDTALFKMSTRKMRAGKCVLGSGTEGTNQAADETLALDLMGEDWAYWHPRVLGRPGDCWLSWPKERWEWLERDALRLTEFRATTAKKVKLLPSTMPWALLKWRGPEKMVCLFSTAHNNLDNTDDRAAAWLDEAKTFNHFQRQMSMGALTRRFPGHKILKVHQADVNKNFREMDERRAVQTKMLAGTGLHPGWHLMDLPRFGTHGPRDIIDWCVTNTDSDSRIMAPDKFSDHNMIETTSRV